MRILVSYDGSIHSKTALRYGISKVKEGGGELRVLHVFQKSMFIDYGAGPWAEEAAKAEAGRFIEEAKLIIKEEGASSEVFSVEGDPHDETISFALANETDLILAPPRLRSIVKAAPCPVCIIPGNILVPVDNAGVTRAELERIEKEAESTGSSVTLLGVIPVHMYGRWEENELDGLMEQTASVMKKIMDGLNVRGIKTKAAIRSGYPDIEIMKAAEEYSASMIIMPAGADEPSEMKKAASILLEEAGTLRRPLVIA